MLKAFKSNSITQFSLQSLQLPEHHVLQTNRGRGDGGVPLRRDRRQGGHVTQLLSFPRVRGGRTVPRRLGILRGKVWCKNVPARL